jgi:hypothetical protein
VNTRLVLLVKDTPRRRVIALRKLGLVSKYGKSLVKKERLANEFEFWRTDCTREGVASQLKDFKNPCNCRKRGDFINKTQPVHFSSTHSIS